MARLINTTINRVLCLESLSERIWQYNDLSSLSEREKKIDNIPCTGSRARVEWREMKPKDVPVGLLIIFQVIIVLISENVGSMRFLSFVFTVNQTQ